MTFLELTFYFTPKVYFKFYLKLLYRFIKFLYAKDQCLNIIVRDSIVYSNIFKLFSKSGWVWNQ